MILLDLNICAEPGVLTTFMILRIVINVCKIVVPFLLMFKCYREVAPLVVSGESISKHIGPIVKSLVAAFAVFCIPTLLNYIFISFSDFSTDSYGSCITNANLETIKQMKEAQKNGNAEYGFYGPDATKKPAKKPSKNPSSGGSSSSGDSSGSGSSSGGSSGSGSSSGGSSGSGSSSGGSSGGSGANISGDWKSSVFPLPSGATTCRSSVFGPRYHPITGEYQNHSGDDYPAACGTTVYAVLGGKVVEAANDGGYHGGMGNYVKIQHSDGLYSVYMHASSVSVKSGQTVKTGQQIMKVGTTGDSTGCHLHISIRNGSGNNLSPSKYIPTLPAC